MSLRNTGSPDSEVPVGETGHGVVRCPSGYRLSGLRGACGGDGTRGGQMSLRNTGSPDSEVPVSQRGAG